jgi:hypothetical protein
VPEDRPVAEPLERRLAALGDAVAWPVPDPSMPAAVAARIAAAETQRTRARWPSPFGRPVRRGLVLAVVLLVVLAAVAAAVGLGLRGIRIVFAPSSPAASVDVPRSGLLAGLGTAVDGDDAAAIVGFEPLLPAGLGEPGAWFVADRRLTIVWPATPDRPALAGTDVGVLVTEFRGDVDEGWFEKIVDAETATVEPVSVGGRPGYWIAGQPHQLIYRTPDGQFVEETRRPVADVLLWEAGDLTLRMETALGRDATIDLAETIAADR